MFHLSSGDPFVLYVCVSGRLSPRVCQDAPSFGNSLSRCSIFRQVTRVCMCVCVSGRLGPCVCQDTLSFGNSLSRCSIFRKETSVCVCVCICVCVWAFGSLCMSECSIFWQQPAIFRQVTLSSSVHACQHPCLCVSVNICV